MTRQSLFSGILIGWTWDPAILWYYPLIVLGNYADCNVRRIVLSAAERQ